jgi:hypothetical protein
VLCTELVPPEGVIPQLPEAMPGQTNRERVANHTSDPACATCHEPFINPIGFAFENFDALGQIRTMDAGQPVNTASSYTFYDGPQSFNDAPELLTLIANNEMTHACYSARLAEFVLSRDLDDDDRSLVSYVQSVSLSDTPSIKQMVFSLVTDPTFTNRIGGT